MEECLVLRLSKSLLIVLTLNGTSLPAIGQSYSDSIRQSEERDRQYAERRRQDQERAHQMVQEDIRRDKERWNQPTPGSAGGTLRKQENSFATAAIGVAAVGLSAAWLHEIFVSGSRNTGADIPPGARINPSVERWLQDPFNRPGEPRRFDTSDGLISKVCIRPFPGVQTVIYRWDAPNEAPNAAEIRETPSREHMQFTHPSALGLFIYVTKPAPDHKPSERVYWLAAHRIGMTGCGHAQAYQIAYHTYGGPPEFENLARRREIKQEEPIDRQPPFTKTCQTQHSQANCVCVGINLTLRKLVPDLWNQVFNREEISAALRRQPGALESVARNCKIQF